MVCETSQMLRKTVDWNENFDFLCPTSKTTHLRMRI